MGLEVLVVVNAEEGLDLTGQEKEEILGGTGRHELPRDHDLGLSEGEGGVAVQLNGAHTEVGAAQIDCEIETLFSWLAEEHNLSAEGIMGPKVYLFRAIGDCGHKSGNLAQCGVFLCQTLV
jgi:hypothetical protein